MISSDGIVKFSDKGRQSRAVVIVSVERSVNNESIVVKILAPRSIDVSDMPTPSPRGISHVVRAYTSNFREIN